MDIKFTTMMCIAYLLMHLYSWLYSYAQQHHLLYSLDFNLHALVSSITIIIIFEEGFSSDQLECPFLRPFSEFKISQFSSLIHRWGWVVIRNQKEARKVSME